MASDIRTLLGIASLERLRLLNRYDVENITPELFDYSVKTILSEPQLDLVIHCPRRELSLPWSISPDNLTSGLTPLPSASRFSPRGSGPWCALPGCII